MLEGCDVGRIVLLKMKIANFSGGDTTSANVRFKRAFGTVLFIT